jgi:hypothetical protein
MANEIAEVEKNPVELRDGKSSKKKQRAALHKMLSNDDEYENMQDHVLISETIEDSLDAEVQNETRLVTVSNIMKLVYMDVQGYGADALATNMKLSRDDVQLIRRSSAFQNAKEAMMADIVAKSRQMIEVSTMKAVKTLTECMESKNDKVRLSAAVEVLNRTGLTATQKIELTTTNNSMMNFTEDELAEIVRSGMAIPTTGEVV